VFTQDVPFSGSPCKGTARGPLRVTMSLQGTGLKLLATNGPTPAENCGDGTSSLSTTTNWTVDATFVGGDPPPVNIPKG